MKKTLIASACALTLCFTSCASKQAPDTTPQTEIAPQLEQEIESSTETESESDNSEVSDENNSQENTIDSNEESEELTSEDFPEPELIEEPEIVTLEPQDEVIEENEQEETEPVENEEPPEIIVVVTDDDNVDEALSSDEQEDASTEPENVTDISEDSEDDTPTEEDNSVEDITANDVIIVSNQDTDGISGGIDITDDDSDSSEEFSETEEAIVPSRSVTLKKFEYLDVTYPGTGWIFMGLTDISKDIAYFGRKLGTKDTKFTLQARAAGTKIIHFYKNDPLTGQYLDDYIEVIIQTENGSNKTHIEAPEFKLPIQKKEKPVEESEEANITEDTVENKEAEKTSAKTSSNSTDNSITKSETKKETTTSTATASSTSAADTTSSKDNAVTATQTQNDASVTASSVTINPDTLLQEAQLLYNEKEYKTALSKLNQFFEFSTDNRDEALYLKGQILEAKSDVRDIKGAMDAYSTLTKNYPASKYWDSANKRIIYLKRFYLEVR